MADDYRQHLIKKRSGVQAYCDQCEWSYQKTGRYPRICPGMDRFLKHAIRRRMKLETRKALHEATA